MTPFAQGSVEATLRLTFFLILGAATPSVAQTYGDYLPGHDVAPAILLRQEPAALRHGPTLLYTVDDPHHKISLLGLRRQPDRRPGATIRCRRSRSARRARPATSATCSAAHHRLRAAWTSATNATRVGFEMWHSPSGGHGLRADRRAGRRELRSPLRRRGRAAQPLQPPERHPDREREDAARPQRAHEVRAAAVDRVRHPDRAISQLRHQRRRPVPSISPASSVIRPTTSSRTKPRCQRLRWRRRLLLDFAARSWPRRASTCFRTRSAATTRVVDTPPSRTRMRPFTVGQLSLVGHAGTAFDWGARQPHLQASSDARWCSRSPPAWAAPRSTGAASSIAVRGDRPRGARGACTTGSVTARSRRKRRLDRGRSGSRLSAPGQRSRVVQSLPDIICVNRRTRRAR